MNNQPNGIILLPHLRVQNSNAISGPLSWGFPPPSAFAGFVHALDRKLGTRELPTAELDVAGDFGLDGVGIVCHRFEPQVNGSDYRLRFNLSKNPVDNKKKIDKDGSLKGTSIVEEGRAHLEVTLVIGVRGDLDQEDGDMLAQRVASAAQNMRLAGGSVLPQVQPPSHRPQFHGLSGYMDEDRKAFKRIRRKLLPGFALVDRHDLLQEHHAAMVSSDSSVDLLDTLLDLCAIHFEPQTTGEGESEGVAWRVYRRKPGWLVPLPIGYGAISPLYEPGQVKNARDPGCSFRFVESLYSLGEWKSPHRIDLVQDMLWSHEALPEQGLYLFGQQKAASSGTE